MKPHEKRYGDPKPHRPSQFPFHRNGETQNRHANQCWPRKIKSSKMIEPPQDEYRTCYQAQYAPPAQAYLLGCF